MKPVLVTGATGFIGWHVAASLLIGARARVAAWCGPSSRSSRELEVELVAAICGTRIARSRRCRVAGWFFMSRPITGSGRAIPKSCIDRTWRERGTCWKRRGAAGVERVVYTSTVGCIGVPGPGIGDETAPVTLEEMHGAVQAVEVSGRRRAASNSPRQGVPGRDREPDRAGRGS